ncbi:hypothetical protein ACJX0J_029770 [Zea mays]
MILMHNFIQSLNFVYIRVLYYTSCEFITSSSLFALGITDYYQFCHIMCLFSRGFFYFIKFACLFIICLPYSHLNRRKLADRKMNFKKIRITYVNGVTKLDFIALILDLSLTA